jgi:predicted Zn finger-like uncharacterized protein
MTASKLTCPECSTVLRPAKPVPAGKKVKCPRCETVFTAGGEDEEDAPPPKAAVRKSSAKEPAKRSAGAAAPKKPEPPKKSDDEDDGVGVYGYIKEEGDDEEEEEKKKPQISYAPDLSIKDLRGPAVTLLMPPTNKVALCGMLGFIGWLVFIIMLIIPALLPITEDRSKPKEVMKIGKALGSVDSSSGGFGMPGGMPGMGGGPGPGGMPGPGGGGGGGGAQPAGANPKMEKEENASSFFEIASIDFSTLFDLPWYQFLPSLIPFVVLMLYSGLVAYGAIKLQNLESYGWGMASSIMVMIPMTCCGGVILVFGMCIQFFLGMLIEDPDYIGLVASVVAAGLWLSCVAVGIWSLTTLMSDEVKAGFEYKAE